MLGNYIVAGHNLESIVDWGEVIRLQREEQNEEMLQEQKRCQQLKQKIGDVICNNYSSEELKGIQLYKDAIFSYLKDNGKLDLVNNESALSSCVNIYYRILKGENVGIEEYAFLQSYSRTSENKVTGEISDRYFASKRLIENIIGKEQDTFCGEDNSINVIVDIILRMSKSNGLDCLLFVEIKEALRTINYLHSCSNLNMNLRLKGKQRMLTL